MKKHIPSLLIFLVFTAPLCGYFIVNGYWWLFDGNHPIPAKMTAAGFLGFMMLMINGVVYSEEK